MQFLFVSTDLCSPAFFTACLTANQLAACYALFGFAHRDLHPLDNLFTFPSESKRAILGAHKVHNQWRGSV